MNLPYPININVLKDFPIFFSCIPIDLLDQDGRPILEGRSIYNKPSDSDYSICQYQGKRKKNSYPMNKEALRKAWKHADEIISILHLFKSQAKYIRKISKEKVTLADVLYTAALSGFKTANYYLADSVLNESKFTYPSHLSAVSKICHGLCHLTHNCDKRIIEYCFEKNKIDELYDYIDCRELLIGHQTREVCAGPAMMIKRILAIFTSFSSSESSERITKQINNYYSYASIVSLFELLSCHYEFYNICHHRYEKTPLQQKNTIPYSHYLHSAEKEIIVKDIPILCKLSDHAWCVKEYDYLIESINKTVDLIKWGVANKDFSNKGNVDADCLKLFNIFNDELYKLFEINKISRMKLQHLTYFFNS